jgi:hypothetical protein
MRLSARERVSIPFAHGVCIGSSVRADAIFGESRFRNTMD